MQDDKRQAAEPRAPACREPWAPPRSADNSRQAASSATRRCSNRRRWRPSSRHVHGHLDFRRALRDIPVDRGPEIGSIWASEASRAPERSRNREGYVARTPPSDRFPPLRQVRSALRAHRPPRNTGCATISFPTLAAAFFQGRPSTKRAGRGSLSKSATSMNGRGEQPNTALQCARRSLDEEEAMS